MGARLRLPPAGAAERPARGRRATVAVQVHTDFASSYAEVYSGELLGAAGGRMVGRMAQGYTRRLLSAADLRLAPSPFQAERLAVYGLPVETIPLGVDTDVFSPQAADHAVREELNVPPGAVLAIYVGRLDSEKRTETLAAAASRADAVSPTVLVMIGEGPHREDLEAQQAAAPRSASSRFFRTAPGWPACWPRRTSTPRPDPTRRLGCR